MNKKFFFILINMLVLLGLAYFQTKPVNKIEILDYASIECPDSRDFYLENGDILLELYNKNLINYTFKPVDLVDFIYDKKIYERMTSNHLKLPNIISIFQYQDTWNKLSTLEEIQALLKLNKHPIKENVDNLESTKTEISSLNLKSFPGIYINGTLIDYSINKEDLSKILHKIIFKKGRY